MCGKATILLEAAKNFKVLRKLMYKQYSFRLILKILHTHILQYIYILQGVFCVGCDINQDQLKQAQENIKFANVEKCVQLIRGDCTG